MSDRDTFVTIRDDEVRVDIDAIRADAVDKERRRIAGALLGDDAIEAAARAAHRTEHLLTGAWDIHALKESQWLGGPRTLNEEERSGYRYVAKLSSTAALEAIGIITEEVSDE